MEDSPLLKYRPADKIIMRHSSSRLKATESQPDQLKISKHKKVNSSICTLSTMNSLAYFNSYQSKRLQSKIKSQVDKKIKDFLPNKKIKNKRNANNSNQKLSKSAFMKYESIKDKTSKEMSYLFFTKANKFLKESLTDRNYQKMLIPKIKDAETFGKKLVQDFHIMETKHNIEHSKKWFNQMMGYLELKQNLEKEKVKKILQKFYQKKEEGFKNKYIYALDNKSLDLSEMRLGINEKISEQEMKICRNNHYKWNLKKIKAKSLLLSKSLLNFNCKEYEPIDEKVEELNPLKINNNNLDRFIKLYLIQKQGFDLSDDLLFKRNVQGLRQIGKEIDSINIDNISIDALMERKKQPKKFKNRTVLKFKGSSGKFFGIPV